MNNEEIERRLRAAEEKADRAAEVALAAIASQKSLHEALEKSHQQMGEMLSAYKHISRLAETLATSILTK